MLDAAIEATIEKIEATATQFSAEMERARTRMTRGALKAQEYEALRALLTPDVMAYFMKLQGKPHGFLTDQKTGYSADVVREVLLHAFIEGVYPFGNEFNIIKGRLMIVKNGWARKLREIPGLSFPRITIGDVTETSRAYVVPFTASWRVEGADDSMSSTVLIHRDTKMRRGDGGSSYTKDDSTTTDNIVGRAERKIMQRLYQVIAGQDVDEEPETAASVQQSQPAEAPGVRARLMKLLGAEYAAAQARGLDAATMADLLYTTTGHHTSKDVPTDLLLGLINAVREWQPPTPAVDPDADLEPEPGSMFPAPPAGKPAAMEDRR